MSVLMKFPKRVMLLLLFVLFQTCLFAQSSNISLQKEVISKVEEVLEDGNVNLLKVKIVNAHNGSYRVFSKISKIKGGIQVETHTIDMTGVENDVMFVLSPDALKGRLRFTAKNASLIFAGHYQQITLSYNDYEYNFTSRDAHGLISLLKVDAPTPAEKQRNQLLKFGN